MRLGDLLDFVRADAGGADADAAAGTVNQSANRLEVEVPAALGDVVGVADFIAERGLATANFTNLCHKTEISRAVRKNEYSNEGVGMANVVPWRCLATWGRSARRARSG